MNASMYFVRKMKQSLNLFFQSI